MIIVDGSIVFSLVLIKGLKNNLPDTKLVLLSLTSMGDSWGHKNKIAAYNNVIIKMLSEKYDCAFVDLYTPLFDFDTGEIKEEYTTDGAHLTHAGYEVFTSTLMPVLETLLG